MSKLSWLLKETKVWVNSGIISGDQADRIIGLYPAENKNRLISALLLLGAILLGAGMIMFFASNWQYIPKWGKIVLVLIPLMLFYFSSALTYNNYPRVSRTLLLLGCIMFGSGIWLVAQIFHVNAHFPNGILFWLLGVLPVAFFLKEELPLGLCALLLASWVLAEQSSSLFIIFVAMMLFGALFYLTYHLRSSFALVIGLISAAIFISTELSLLLNDNYRFDNAAYLIPFILMLIGSSIFYISELPVNYNIEYFPFIYKLIGIVTAGISLLFMSFAFFPPHFIELRHSGAGFVLFWVLYIAVAVLGAYAMSRYSRDFKIIIKENFAWLAIDALAFIMLLVPLSETTLLLALNIFIFIWALAVIISGYQTQSNMHFTLGLIAFNLYIIAEYFNLFWKMLPKSLFFIAGGLVLMAGGALMEWQRRKVVHSWQKEEVAPFEKDL